MTRRRRRGVKPAQVRFYIDADVLGLAKILVQVRPDVTYPGDPGGVKFKRRRPECPIKTTQTDDDIWIPTVTSQGWLIITRDRHIQVQPREIEAVREHGARMVRLVGEESGGTFDQLEVLLCNWRAIQRLLDERGPYIYLASRTSLRRLDLD